MSDQQVMAKDGDQDEREWVDPRAGMTDAEIKTMADIYDEPYVTARELAEELDLYLNTVRRKIDMVDGKPSQTSEFPNAYKPAGLTSPVRIPVSDVMAYKARKVAGVKVDGSPDV